MAFLASIGRGLTALGTDLRQNRLAREEREQHFADLKDQRAYAEQIRDEQAAIRAAETQANRTWTQEQDRLRRGYEEARDIRLTEEAAARAAADRIETDRLARQRQADAWARADALYEKGVTGAEDIMLAGQPTAEGLARLGVPPSFRRVLESGDVRSAPTPRSFADVGRASINLPTSRQPSASEQTAVRNAVAAAAEVVDEEGNVIDYRWDPYEQNQRAQAILRGENPGNWPESYAVPEPTFEPELIKTPGARGWWQRTLPWGKTGAQLSTPPVAADVGADVGAPQGTRQPRTRQRLPEPFDLTNPWPLSGQPFGGVPGTAGQPDIPPGIDPDMLRFFQEQGMTQREIDEWIARQTGRGGR